MTGPLSKLLRHLPTVLKRPKFETNTAILLCMILMITVLLRLRYEPVDPGLRDKSEEMYTRVVHLREACGRIPPQRHLKVFVNGRRLVYVSEKYSLSYCEVTSASSTFWAQLFMALAGINPKFHDYEDVSSMFELPKKSVQTAIKQQFGLTMELDDKRVKLTTKLLMARNPYSRLFSAYIDQIYLPMKWKAASKMVQGNPKQEECGSDVSFDQFLAYVSDNVLSKKKADISWAPVFSVCLPCETGANIVVKQETLAEDAEFVLNYIQADEIVKEQARNVSAGYIRLNDLENIVKESVESGHLANRGCISEDELAKRIWTALQIKGYIHNDIIFPEEKFKLVFRDDLKSVLTNEVLQAVNMKQLTREERDAQRREWKLSFWRQVSKDTMIKVQAAYYEDFTLFQYEIDPNKM